MLAGSAHSGLTLEISETWQHNPEKTLIRKVQTQNGILQGTTCVKVPRKLQRGKVVQCKQHEVVLGTNHGCIIQREKELLMLICHRPSTVGNAGRHETATTAAHQEATPPQYGATHSGGISTQGGNANTQRGHAREHASSSPGDSVTQGGNKCHAQGGCVNPGGNGGHANAHSDILCDVSTLDI